jgi:integrase
MECALEYRSLFYPPSAEVVVDVSEKHETKMRGFTDKEAAIILSAALAPMSNLMTRENAGARRWVPWICAYTGARVNEITQLRANDVVNVDGIDCIRITSEAGTVKTLRERVVPLHPHLTMMGSSTRGTGRKQTARRRLSAILDVSGKVARLISDARSARPVDQPGKRSGNRRSEPFGAQAHA